MFSILFNRASSIDLSRARIWSKSACILAVGVGSSGPEATRKAGRSGPLIIRNTSPETETNSLNAWVTCTAGLFLGILVIPLVLLGVGRLDHDLLETHGTGAIELFSRSSPRQGVHNWLDPLGFRGGGIGRRREAEK